MSRIRKFLIPLLMVGTLSVAAFFISAIGAASNGTPALVRLTQANNTGIQIEINAPVLSIGEGGEVEAAGLDHVIRQIGAPALPYYSTLVALPPGADVVLDVTVGKNVEWVSAELPFNADIADYSRLQAGLDKLEADTLEAYGQSDLAEPTFNTRAGLLFPDQQVEISEPMYLRDLRVVRLTVYPYRYDAGQQQVATTSQINIELSFSGGSLTNAHYNDEANDYGAGQAENILNYVQSRGWHQYPSLDSAEARTQAAVTLPIDQQVYKIEVDHDGIYEITYAELVAASNSSTVAAINPSQIGMIYRGESTAFEFVGDGDNSFEAGESIRFYGWQFNERPDRMHVSRNIYWLVPNGTTNNIQTISNPNGLNPTTEVLTTVTTEEENIFHSTWDNNWASHPNKPDAFYWDKFNAPAGDALRSYDFNLPHVSSSAATANYLVEIGATYGVATYNITATVNSNASSAISNSWVGKRNQNLQQNIAQNILVSGNNTVELALKNGSGEILFNRITVEYSRELIADNDQLIIKPSNPTSAEYQISGFTETDANELIAWDISNANQPIAIPLTAPDFTAGIARIGSNSGQAFVVTTQANLQSAAEISTFTAQTIDPTDGADWVAISHSDFISEINKLATYRQSADGGEFSTYVVDIEQIINQYGYGLPLPVTIQDYMKNAMSAWSTKPTYLVLVGDASNDVRNIACGSNCDQTFVPTDLPFIDRFQGMIPSDFIFTHLVGNDILPDISVGRMPLQTQTEAKDLVDKIILYEKNLDKDFSNKYLFIADDTDAGGNFCQENVTTISSSIPSSILTPQLCLDNLQPTDLRNQMFNSIQSGVGIVNYRGHGSIETWSEEGLMSASGDVNSWTNIGKPTIVLSADCLDGHYTWSGLPALSETFLKLGELRGSVAHWSSSGLGYSYEHTALHLEFYQGLYNQNIDRIGDAIVYSKLQYIDNSSGHVSEVYSFIFQGDPAMRVPKTQSLYIPIINNN